MRRHRLASLAARVLSRRVGRVPEPSPTQYGGYLVNAAFLLVTTAWLAGADPVAAPTAPAMQPGPAMAAPGAPAMMAPGAPYVAGPAGACSSCGDSGSCG